MCRTVLIVEDCPQTAANLEMALAGLRSTRVVVAASGAEALKWLESRANAPVAAVITDLEMPKMNGFELIERLRSDPRYSHMPIIVSSGSSDPGSPRRALDLGADAYFAKPYSPRELLRKLHSLLGEDEDNDV